MGGVSPRFLIVDGHSVIYAWPELRTLHQGRPREARETLIRRLERFHDVGTWEVTVIFDGRSGTPPPRRPGDMVVAYSRKDQTADSVIEGMVAGHPNRQAITVVTADHAERTTVEALGGFCASPEWLRLEMAAAQVDFEEDFRQFRRHKGGGERGV
jgi:predicted RNA-binding protein with PIN domain